MSSAWRAGCTMRACSLHLHYKGTGHLLSRHSLPQLALRRLLHPRWRGGGAGGSLRPVQQRRLTDVGAPTGLDTSGRRSVGGGGTSAGGTRQSRLGLTKTRMETCSGGSIGGTNSVGAVGNSGAEVCNEMRAFWCGILHAHWTFTDAPSVAAVVTLVSTVYLSCGITPHCCSASESPAVVGRSGMLPQQRVPCKEEKRATEAGTWGMESAGRWHAPWCSKHSAFIVLLHCSFFARCRLSVDSGGRVFAACVPLS